MFDLNFYTETALNNFIAAAQSAIDENTPPTRCEELYEQDQYYRIQYAAMGANGKSLPVQVSFKSDLVNHVSDLIEFYLLPREGLSADCDLREAIGLEFD
jgi:hypothetical protein